jgi:succinate dehydrogenase/fumarate reductase flavoprotein subunit
MTQPADDDLRFDVVVVGAGNAGLPCAIEASAQGLRTLLVEKDVRIGGCLHTTGGHLSAAGARRQRDAGIEDSVEAHLADVRELTGMTHRDDLVQIALEHAAEAVDWLDDHGFRFAPETPRLVYGHPPYSVARTYYGPDGGLSILETLTTMLEEQKGTGRLTVWTDAPLVGLVLDPEDRDRVMGVDVIHRGTDVRIEADAVVLATGGFASDAELFTEIEGVPLVSAAHSTDTGDGLVLARELGAALQGEGKFLPTFGGLPHPTTPGRVQWEDRPVLTTPERAPWEIYVDRSGNRWVAEDAGSIDTKERALMSRVDDLTFWTVFDDRGRRESVPMVVNWSPDDIDAKANVRAGVFKADSIDELAERAGIDAEGLWATIERYNASVGTGRDDDFGRTFLPAPIAQPPFYAMENHGIALLTYAGIDVDTELRVRRTDGSTFSNLYAIGEAIGGAATHGHAILSGMTCTPAIVFGRLVAQRLAQ